MSTEHWSPTTLRHLLFPLRERGYLNRGANRAAPSLHTSHLFKLFTLKKSLFPTLFQKGDINMISIAIDGPSGAGKSTIARMVAKDLGYLYVDTGALYRTIGLYAVRKGVDPEDENGVSALLPELDIWLTHENGVQQVYLLGENVSEEIRRPEMSKAASNVSRHPTVRAYLLETQRKLARENNVLMDGRDIGTVVLPDAQVKIFLTASAEKRAERRYKEQIDKGDHSQTYEQVLEAVIQRDYNDSHRAIAPLKQAEDSVLADTSELDLEQSVQLIKDIIREKCAAL